MQRRAVPPLRLSLPIPDSFLPEELGPGFVRAKLPGGVTLEGALCFGAPVDEVAWTEGALLRTVPPGEEADFVSPEPLPSDGETAGGWRFQLLAIELTGGGLHLGAFYRFLAYAAEVRIFCPSRAAYGAAAEPLRRILLGAKVEWPDPAIATLAGLCG